MTRDQINRVMDDMGRHGWRYLRFFFDDTDQTYYIEGIDPRGDVRYMDTVAAWNEWKEAHK